MIEAVYAKQTRQIVQTRPLKVSLVKVPTTTTYIPTFWLHLAW